MKKVRNGQGLMTIIKGYAVVFGIVIVGFVSIISAVLAREIYSKERDAVQQALLHVEDMYAEDRERPEWMADRLFGDPQKIESAQNYFDMNYADAYMEYLKKSSVTNSGTYYFLPKEVENFYRDDPWLTGLSFSFTSFPKIYSSTLEDKSGSIEKELPKNEKDIRFSAPLLGSNDDVMGTISISVNPKKYANILMQYQNLHKIDFLVMSDQNQVLYESSANLQKKINSDKYLSVVRENNDFTFVTMVPKAPIYRSIASALGLLWVGSIIIMLFLILLLYRLIMSYQFSVSDILHTLNKVGEGDMEVRIAEEGKKSELLEISKSVNQMLDNIKEYVVDNYRLENEQKEANIRALQSQINPHFLYNTLEYIRMYAVNVGADELADVVFAFSRLLRNNISQEKFTTLEKEIEFCEKYAYLYQMRYPDCLAYGFTIDPAIRDKQIPKFIIQPLIENYFIHGVDFSRVDNVGRVKAYTKDDRIIIEVIDNGLGMADETLEEFRHMAGDLTDIHKGKSVGIKNIYQRLRFYYGGDFTFTFRKNEPAGTIVTISIPLQKEDKENV